MPKRSGRTLGCIAFLIYSRAAPGAEPDQALTEEHWSYMDRFADGMIARGPTLAPDRETWTGSLHIVALPSVEAAYRFADEEPYQRAGMFAEHLILRFDNRLGRTMWEHPAGSEEPRFLVIGSVFPPVDVELIVHGDLFTPDDGEPAGVALALQAPSREAVAALVGDDAPIFDWEFGGRR
jgi:uncharacterized protein YciI